jgi:hypothetical protein
MRTGDFRKSFTARPSESVAKGPVLAEARYPDVLVAKALSHGDDLDLVLYPGTNNGGASHALRIERLRPGAEYSIEGTGRRLRADDTGTAAIDVPIEGRTALRVTPV